MSFGHPEGRTRSTGLPLLALLLLGPPVSWAAHLGLVYLLVTIDCETTWNGSGWTVALATVLLGAACAAAGVISWRRWRGEEPREERSRLDAREPRPFVYLLGVAGAVLFGVTIVVTGVVPWLTGGCG